MRHILDEYGRIVLRIVIFLLCSVLVGGVYYHMKDVVFDPVDNVISEDTDVPYNPIDPQPTPTPTPPLSGLIATYNINTDSDPIGKLTPDSAPQSFSITPGQKYSMTQGGNLASAFRYNHKFLGWYTNKSGGTKVDNNTVVDPGLKTNVILYAHWENLNYTMTLTEPIARYTGDPVDPVEIVKQGGKKLTENTDFTASYEHDTPPDTSIEWDALAIATGKGDHPTLYLTQPYKIKRQDYPIKYDMNTGTGTIPDQTKWWGLPLQLSTVIPTKTGWTFTRWNTKANGSGTAFESGATIGATERADNEAKTLYAQYRANKYTVVYDANRPANSIVDTATDVSVESQTNLSYDTSYNFRTNTYRTKGYTAAGWNTKADGTGTPYTPGDSFKNLTTVDNGTVTLYAQWIDNDPTIEITSINPAVYKSDNVTLNYVNTDVAVVVHMTDYGSGLDKLELIKGTSDTDVVATYNAEKEKDHNYTATYRIMDADNYYFKVYDKEGHTAQVKLVLPHIDKVNPEIIITD